MNFFRMVMNNTVQITSKCLQNKKINSGKTLMNLQAKPPPLSAVGAAMPQPRCGPSNRVHFCPYSPLNQISFKFPT